MYYEVQNYPDSKCNWKIFEYCEIPKNKAMTQM